MRVIKKTQWEEMNLMQDKWKKFKRNREKKIFNHEQGKGFITIMQREKMLDRLFDILNYGIEEF